MTWFDGQSGGDTPGLFPNPEVKPTSAPHCTVVRESTGTADRCQPLFYIFDRVINNEKFSKP